MKSTVPVYLVEANFEGLPLSLGAIETYTRHVHGEALDDLLHFVPISEHAGNLDLGNRGPGIWLFPNYIWSTPTNLQLARRIAAQDPRHILVHGGPSSPVRAHASELFLNSQPGVDIVCRGEGEATGAELLPYLATALLGGRDWRDDGLRDVAGVAFLDRPGGELVYTQERPRIKVLSGLPSPYLSGAMGPWMKLRDYTVAMLETNRGCPYGCSFCDWGMATLQKIHLFDIDRVLEEIEWLARNKFDRIFITDANFGIFDRDVEIAEHMGAMRRKYGYPLDVNISYAKNGNKNIPRIVDAVVSAGTVTQGIISIQTIDENTLKTIRRSNIKTKHYEQLVRDFRTHGLPVATEMMLGLPGSTFESHKNDLQWAIDEDLSARLFQTIVLPNSPLAQPEYIEEHEIEIENGVVVASKSASRSELSRATGLATMYDFTERSTALRYIVRYVQWEYGVKVSDFLAAFMAALETTPERFPSALPREFAAYKTDGARPAGQSMGAFVAEIGEDPDGFYFDAIWNLCIERLGVPLGSDADRAIFDLNAHLIPRPDISYPFEYSTDWDVLRYFAVMTAPVEGEQRKLVRLDTPQSFTISNPNEMTADKLRGAILHNSALRAFELDWPNVNSTAIYPILDVDENQAAAARSLAIVS